MRRLRQLLRFLLSPFHSGLPGDRQLRRKQPYELDEHTKLLRGD